MTERPLPMRSHEVKAILRGEMTQFRRIMKVQPSDIGYTEIAPYSTGAPQHGYAYYRRRKDGVWESTNPIKCPYGKPGDQFWVKEAWCFKEDPYNADGNHDSTCVFYRADGVQVRAVDGDGFQRWNKDGSESSPWSPSIHMPRWASRIQLEITNVRVERLNLISDEDCIREGIEVGLFAERWGEVAYRKYQALWDSIHGKGSWQLNPWVWVVEFKQVNKGMPLPEPPSTTNQGGEA